MKAKNILQAMATLLVAMFCIGLTSCSSSSDDASESPTNLAVGSWSGPRYDGPNKESKGNRLLMLVFKSDGSGTYVNQDDDYKNKGVFNYVMEGSNKGKIRFDDNLLYDYFFVIEGNKMSIYDKDYGDDIDWILTKE